MLRLTRGQFGLSLPRALVASYLATRAQMAFARQGERGGGAEAFMRRFYRHVREPVGGRYDPRRAAELEVRWWVIHRERDQHPDRSALTAALAASYAEVHRVPVGRVAAAADFRAHAMDVSDRWVRDGKAPDSPLLGEIAELLVASYRALSEAAATPA